MGQGDLILKPFSSQDLQPWQKGVLDDDAVDVPPIHEVVVHDVDAMAEGHQGLIDGLYLTDLDIRRLQPLQISDITPVQEILDAGKDDVLVGVVNILLHGMVPV